MKTRTKKIVCFSFIGIFILAACISFFSVKKYEAVIVDKDYNFEYEFDYFGRIDFAEKLYVVHTENNGERRLFYVDSTSFYELQEGENYTFYGIGWDTVFFNWKIIDVQKVG